MIWQPDQLEQVQCDLCGARQSKPVALRTDGMAVVECTGCGLAFLNPRPKAGQIHLLYDSSYFSSGGGAGVGYEAYCSDESRAAHAATAANKLRMVGARLGLAGKRVLEVGCASGEFCQALHNLKCSVVGVDLSPQVVALARSRYPHLDLRAGELASVLDAEKFFAIFAWEVVEHVLSPVAFFAQLSRHLEPGGFLALSTPNYACTRLVGPDRWVGFKYSFEHLYFFDRLTIEKVAKPSGLQFITSYSGGGSGVEAPPQPVRSFVRKVLAKSGALPFLRRMRNAARPGGIGYTAGREDQHNLIVILQRRA